LAGLWIATSRYYGKAFVHGTVAGSRQFNISLSQDMCKCALRGFPQYKCLTVNRDALTLGTCSDKGKPVERRGRKATGLKEVSSYDGGAATIAQLARTLALLVGNLFLPTGGRFIGSVRGRRFL
jgi:hypothetical protein